MTRSGFQLAQVNIGRALGAMDEPVMAGFVAQLVTINALADGSPGFVWRLQTEDGDATAVRPYDDDRIMINLSVWTDLASLQAFVFRSAHTDVMGRSLRPGRGRERTPTRQGPGTSSRPTPPRLALSISAYAAVGW